MDDQELVKLKSKCIICGKEMGEMCYGIIKDMKVSLCRDHCQKCENCEQKNCEKH
jgi:hypothetical protein